MIELIQLVKKFGELTAVDDISLKVERGQFFVLLGPNAAGKTTTLKILAGLMRPTSGSCRIAGFNIESEPLEARRRMAYVPDFPFLYDKLTPSEFFQFISQLFAMREQHASLRQRELVDRFNLEPYLGKAIESLSHGTRQRIAIASGLLHDPEVFILDEPMVGLDPQHARVLEDILKEQTLQGMTVLISTHQLSVAEEMADRIGIMHRGRLVASGSAEQLRIESGKAGRLEEVFLGLTGSENSIEK